MGCGCEKGDTSGYHGTTLTNHVVFGFVWRSGIIPHKKSDSWKNLMIDSIFVCGVPYFQAFPLVFSKKWGMPQKCQETTTNDVILGTCWAWHVFFWQVSSFLQHLTKQVSWTTVWNSCWLFCGMALWLFRVSFELGSWPGNWGQQLGVPVLQMGVTPIYVMSTPDQRPVWSTEKPGGLLMGLSKTRVLSRRFAGE